MKNANELEGNRVIVRVWTSRGNPNEPGESVGHISIQTRNNYMSLWPKQPAGFGEQSAKEQEGKGVSKGISHELLPNYDRDYEYEKREPEVVICLYTLDTTKLDDKFYEFRGRLKGWNVFGICRDCESCASFAWKLLEASGIRKLVSHVKESSVISKGEAVGSGAVSKQSVSSSSQEHEEGEKGIMSSSSTEGASFVSEMSLLPMVKSPDALAEILKEAKQEELKRHAETRDIEYLGETRITLKDPKPCSIM